MAKFFIHRPVFAWVIAIIVMIAGGFGLNSLPIAQYPQIAPTTVRISATYPGASAETVQNAVTAVIEDGMTGLDGMVYMTSNSAESSASVSLTFDDTVDPDMAQVQVQNKLQLVTSRLPSSVQAQGISVTRSTSSILMVGALTSPDGSLSSLELGDLVSRLIEDPVQRAPGVGSVRLFSSEYAMRIWLDPFKLARYGLTANDVTAAVSAQNTNVTVGALGDLPSVPGQQITVSLSAQSQLSTIPEFERILLSTEENGASVFLGDVARIEIGAEDPGTESRYNGNPAAGFAVNLATGANAVETAQNVRDAVAQVMPGLPAGVEVVWPYDTTPFVEASIEQVWHTLAEAIVLVFVVILVFLQSWRATLIPTIAVPVVLLGCFGVLAAFGMSINTLTMFALVLAIGLLVDDAIVVVENVERIMEEEGLGPVEATEKSMGEITGALVGIVLVLSAVFLPMAFMSGSTGVIYRQFSITIISAMVLSLLVALVLTPAMCAQLLKPNSHGGGAAGRAFNRGLDRMTGGYGGLTRVLSRMPLRVTPVLVLVLGGAWWVYDRLPSSFIPTEDQGVLMMMISTPEGATQDRTRATVEKAEAFMLEGQKDAVASTYAALGFSFAGSGQNAGMMFVKLKEYEERPDKPAAALAGMANGAMFAMREGQVITMQPPAVPGMGTSSGFTMQLLAQGGQTPEELRAAGRQLVEAAQAGGRVTQLRGAEDDLRPALKLTIDPQKAQAYGLSISDINSMLTTIFAGRDVNDFTLGTDLRSVIVMGDAAHRMQPGDVEAWHAVNASGELVPFAAFLTQDWSETSRSLARYGGIQALEISGAAAAGVSSGDAMEEMEAQVAALDGQWGVAWTGLSYQERLSGDQEPMLYGLSVIVVFLCLAALYESWSAPFAVMLSVPVGILGALAAAYAFDQTNDVYFKVGLLTTIGLAARNAILIVEFAQDLREKGQPSLEAIVTAARLRLRPILMTTFAFMLGVTPLALASGAGAAAQQSIGIGVLGGVAAAAAFGIILAPVFYAAVLKLTGALRKERKAREEAEGAAA